MKVELRNPPAKTSKKSSWFSELASPKPGSANTR